MKKRFLSLVLVLCIMAGLLSAMPITAGAETYGNLTYTVSDGEATITDCDTSASGPLEIPATLGGYPVTKIGYQAFYKCISLTSVTIPDNVTSIGERAFYDCNSLASITIPDSVTTIGSSACSGCTGLTSVTIPDSVTSIGDYAFNYCSSLASITIGDSITSIGKYAFFYCSSLTSITIPDSVTSIGDYAFNYCSSLASITIGDSVTSIGRHAFDECDSLTSAVIPDSVTYINSYAFRGCTNLADITIGKGVNSIGYESFSGCTSLVDVTIPDSVTYIHEMAFYNCTSLIKVTIGSSVTTIAEDAFYNCSSLARVDITDLETWCNIDFYSRLSSPLYYAEKLYLNGNLLTDLVIPDSVTAINSYAFSNCTSLTSVTIPNGVTFIGDSAFWNCNNLTEVNISSTETWCNISFSNLYSNPLYYAQNLYLDGDLVTELTIPNYITSISPYAFYNCTSLENVVVPDSISSIGYDAFYNCTSLKCIVVPENVTSIGESAFYNCTGLEQIIWNAKNVANFSDGNGIFYNGGKSSEGITVIFGDSVETIPQYVFLPLSSDFATSASHSPNIVKVTIEGKVKNIPKETFYWCDSLKYVILPSELLYVQNDAFNGCSEIETVFYEGSESQWNEILFYNRNENLTNAKIVYNATKKTYKFETNCDATLSDITDYAIFTMPTVENDSATLSGWYDNANLSGEPVTFPYYGDATTLYAAWTDRTGKTFDDGFITKANQEYTVTTTESGQYVYFEFVPNLSKEYRFYTTGSKDTYGYLYNSSKSQIASNDDGGDGNNFYISYNLTAGETYYIAAKLYSGTGTFTFVVEEPVDYRINEITIKDMSGNSLQAIPEASFLATVSFTNVSSSEDAVIILAEYSDAGVFKGLMYIQTEDVPTGSTIKLSIPVDNSKGDVAKLKAFCWESFGSMTPLGNSASFPAE